MVRRDVRSLVRHGEFECVFARLALHWVNIRTNSIKATGKFTPRVCFVDGNVRRE